MTNAKLTDFQPDPHNANAHSERGRAQVTESVQRFGAGRSLLVDRNNRVIAGNLTQEVMAELGFEDAIVIDTDGKTPVIVRRVDIDLDSPEGRGLAIADNRTAEVSLQWSAEELAWAQDAGADLGLWWRGDELEGMWAEKSEPTIPEPTEQLEPKLDSECFIEIYCSYTDLAVFQDVLDEWSNFAGVTVNIS